MSILSLQKQSQNTDFPNLRPSLDLRFALAKKLDPRITFTRGGPGTYFGPDGLMRTAGVNEPRFDHDPITGQSLGLLIEESRTNSLTYSGDVSNAAWGKSNTSIGSAITAPDGSSTGYKVIENTTNGYHFVSQSPGTISGTYTVSCFVKAAERYRGYLQLLGSGGNAAVFFNLRTGTISGAGTNTITPYPNGWYRITSTLTFTSSVGAVCYFVINRDDGTAIYAGDNNSGIYVWGLQVEAGSFPTSYIPTSASPVTRSADLASMEGINFSSWYNQSEGSFISSHIQYDISDTTKNYGVFVVSQSGTSNFIRLFSGGGRTPVLSIVKDGTTSVYTLGSIFYSANRLMKTGCSYSSNIASRTINGNTPITDSSVLLPTSPNNITIGSGGSGVTYLNGTLSRLTYYPIQITNQQLINLTS